MTSRLLSWLDPEWKAFTACAFLLPAAAFAIGDSARADFFLGTASYVCTLKWLGWAILSRGTATPRDPSRWTAELFAGLAFTAAWFYVRNLAGALWPAAYGLGELGTIFPLLLLGHGIGMLRQGRLPDRLREVARQGSGWIPFFLTLGIIFWRISTALEPPSTDPVYHAFSARIYTEHGIFFRGFNGNDPLLYRAGFGALNATAMAIGRLDAVQAVHLQHPLWLLVALSAITGLVATRMGSWPLLLHAPPLAFLTFFPVHNLAPDVNYEGTPRQLSVALTAALVLVPLLCSTEGLRSAVANAWVIGLLAPLNLSLNPACAPFVAVAFVLGIGWILRRTPRAAIGRTFLAGAAALTACSLLVLCFDPFYLNPANHRRILNAGPRVEKPQAPSLRGAVAFAPGAGASRALSQSLLCWSRSPDSAEASSFDELPVMVAVALLACLALLQAQAKQTDPPAPPRGLAWIAFFCALLWIALKCIIGFLVGGLDPTSWDFQLLGKYLVFLQLRHEHLLAFAGGLAATAFILSSLKSLGGRKAVASGALGLTLLAVLLAGENVFRVATPLSHGLVVGPVSPPMGRVTPEDLKLVAWIDRNVPPEKGLIGLACRTLKPGPEKHLYPLAGAQAVPLYGRRLNFCFFQADPGRRFGFDDYVERIQTRFDARWCLQNGIGHFYVSQEYLEMNPGLAEAIADGRLTPIHSQGTSAVYQVREP